MRSLFIMVLIALTFGLSAQTVNTFVADTTTDAETEYSVYTTRVFKGDNIITIGITPLKVSGTSTVLSMPQGSLDNVTFYDLQAASDTTCNAGTVASVKYEYAHAYWKYYRVKHVSTGTGVVTFNGKIGSKPIK